MRQSLTSIAPRAPQQTTRAPLSILRTETVLSRFPIHLLAKRGRVAIPIRRTNAQGALDLRWEVSYNEHYGPPAPARLQTRYHCHQPDPRCPAAPAAPRAQRRESDARCGPAWTCMISGRQQAHLKSAFHQNASAYIVAYLRYRGRDGIERTVNTGFTRYSVIFTGESPPRWHDGRRRLPGAQ